jgi:ethanolamine transporter
LFAAIVAVGISLIPDVCVKIFKWLGIAIMALITVGLVLGILKFLTGFEPIKGLAPIEGEPMLVCFNAAIVMSGAFPLIFVIGKLLKKPSEKLGKKLGINSTSAIGFISSLATNATTFEMMNDMDKKGAMLNSAFAMAGAFTFAGHLAYTMARDSDYILPMIVGKLISGVSAVVLANIIYNRIEKKGTK